MADDGPSRVPLHSLESMTDNFSEDRVLGSSEYGKVYLGKREDGQKIAVKILHDMPEHGNELFKEEFYNLANLQHQNIVRLVGYCHETRLEFLPHNETRVLAEVTKRALCFEFMENGSLNNYLYDEFNGHGWCKRYAIIQGICNGLKYLHEELKGPIFHLDLKPTNILLDKNMIPKIADFGFSRFFKEENSYITNSPVGTLGYLPPEFIHHGIISNKLDIFSLGVVVIKIIAGPTGQFRRAEMTSEQFIEIVHGNWMNRLQSVASGDLLESYSEQVKICVEIALTCVEAERQKRPTIGDIVNMLTEIETLENYQGGLIDQMSTCVVNDTRLIDVYPIQLHFSFGPNKFISCPFHVTNNMDDQHVSVRCVPKHEEANCYYDRLDNLCGVVPPMSTHSFVVTMKQVQQPPANMDVLDMVVETILGEVPSWDDSFETYFKDARKENKRGFREVTLKAACATTCEKTTSEVILIDGHYGELRSMDVHPTEPWILAAYSKRLLIFNYKTQTRMMEHEFYPGLAHSLRNLGSSTVSISTVRFILHSTEQLFMVGDSDGYIHVHDCMTVKRVKEFKAHGDWVTSLAVHPTQPFVLSASGDHLIKLWSWEKGWVCIRTFTGHSDWVNQVKFNPHDANTFASASRDRTVKIWRIFSAIHVTSLKCEGEQACVDYYPTGGDQQHYMVTGSYGGTARIWDLRTQTCIREIKGLQEPCIVGVTDCHPDRPAVLVTASDSYGVSLHDSTTYRCERTVHFGLGMVLFFAYIKGIRSLAIGNSYGVAIMEIDRFSKEVMPHASDRLQMGLEASSRHRLQMGLEASSRHRVLEQMLLDENVGPSSLPLSLLQGITYHFSPLQQIGTGGFAVVYKGMVGKGWVAVKKLTRTHDLPEIKFHREVQCMMKAKHKNIVRFLGYCAETQGEVADCEGKFVMSDLRNWLLCFEFLPNGSLENYITDASSGLEWTERFQIIKGICEGLHYLHMNRILHLDLEPANILLDDHMAPKIADFGLSRCLDERKTHATTTIHKFGTLGYMAPEILCEGEITFASDIYSLGSVIMEILTGKKGYPEDENVTESWIHRIEGGNQLQQVRVCTKIGLECMKFDPEKRPVAQHIIDMLDKVDETATSSSTNSLFLGA